MTRALLTYIWGRRLNEMFTLNGILDGDAFCVKPLPDHSTGRPMPLLAEYSTFVQPDRGSLEVYDSEAYFGEARR